MPMSEMGHSRRFAGFMTGTTLFADGGLSAT
jgi:hypothetical protein